MSTKTQQLFIPEKLNVGFKKREDTYTGKLAYVIYYDKKGVLRKEKSWQDWRDSKIKNIEYANEPTEGFVLNKGVGGQRQSYGWNARNEYIRVYDPRDFEFEISVANLLFILRETGSHPGKGLEGKFVYSWDGTELVLLPVGSQDYKNSQNFTDLQDKTVGVKDLIDGATYTTRKQEDLVYLGRFDFFFVPGTAYSYREPSQKDKKGVIKKFVFWNGKDFVFMNEIKSIAVLKSDTVAPDYAELVDKYNKSVHGSRIAKLFLQEGPPPKDYYSRESWYYEDSPGVFVACSTQYEDWQKMQGVTYIQANHKVFLKDGVYVQEAFNAVAYAPGKSAPHRYGGYYGNKSDEQENKIAYREPTNHRLWVVLESGTKMKFDYYTFAKVK